MILQSLAQRYYDTATAEDAVPFGWAKRDAAFALDLDENGVLHNILLLDSLEGERRVRQVFLLPQEPKGRTSTAVKPAFLYDNSKYIFGLSEKAEGRDRKCFDASKSLHVHLLENINSPAARAIVRFYESWDTLAENPVLTALLADKTLADIFYNARFVFQINGRFAQDDPALRQAWDEECSAQEGEQIRCLVSGKEDTLIRLHGKISLPGMKTSAPLVSINAESFTSYGKRKDDPASQVGEKSAFAYATALNALLKDINHHKRLGSDTLVYWGEEGGEPEAAAFSWIGDPKEDDEVKLTGVMEKFSRGDKLELDNCIPERPFYLLCLSPNAGRISVRFFYQNTFEKMLKNNLEHYQNLEIAMSPNEKFPYLPPWVLLSETTIKKKAAEADPLLGGQLMQSIVSGNCYPRTLYNAILTRIRAGEKINRTKAAIIKAVLVRNFSKESEGITVSLNEKLDKTPYVLGRLFAVLEWVQQKSAKEKLNATIRDKYFTSACANPGSAFPILLKLSVHHIAKLKSPGYYEKLKGQLIDKLEGSTPFPATQKMHEQGLFIVGYYHQIQDFYTSRKDKEEIDNA